MTNPVAAVLALVVLALAAANFWFGWELHLLLGRRLVATIEWMAFWR